MVCERCGYEYCECHDHKEQYDDDEYGFENIPDDAWDDDDFFEENIIPPQ